MTIKTNLYRDDGLPPHSTEDEEALIGALILDGDATLAVAEHITPEDFYGERTHLVYKAALTLAIQGAAVHQMSIADVLIERKEFATVGGQDYLSYAVGRCPSPLYAEHYAKQVHRYAVRRALMQAGAAIVEQAASGDVEAAQKGIAGVLETLFQMDAPSAPQTLAKWMDMHFAQLSEMLSPRQGGILGETTGIKDLDRMLDGLQRGLTYLVAGRTSMGKSEFLAHMARSVAEQGRSVLVFQNEGRDVHYLERLAYQYAHVDKYDLAHPWRAQDTSGKLMDTLEQVRALPIYLLPAPGMTTIDLRVHVMSHLARYRDVGLVIYDQIDLTGDEADNEIQRRAIAIKSLNATASMANVPVVVAAQLNRQSEQRPDKKPTLADIRWSGDLEQHVQGLMLLYRPGYYHERGMGVTGYNEATDTHKLEIIVAKNTGGRTGEVLAYYDPAKHILGDWEEER